VNGLTIVDTDILIDAAHQISEAVDCLAQIERQSVLAVSVITQMELLVGCRNKAELRNTERFLQRFQVLKLSEPVCVMSRLSFCVSIG
jgi:predicted nucleic acid-binding protein